MFRDANRLAFYHFWNQTITRSNRFMESRKYLHEEHSYFVIIHVSPVLDYATVDIGFNSWVSKLNDFPCQLVLPAALHFHD